MRPLPLLALTGVAAAAATGLVFALWVENGPKMFAALVQAGLALCY